MVVSQTDPFDIFSLEARGNHALYARMRREDPIHRALDPRTGAAVWFLTRYDDCVTFMKDKRFGKVPRSAAEPASAHAMQTAINRHMLNLDEPDHTRLKSLVHLVFTPGRVRDLRSRLQAIAEELLTTIDREVAEGDEFDLAAHYGEVFPLLSIMEMLGLPAADYPEFRRWTKTVLLLSEETSTETAILELSHYLNQQIDARRTQANAPDDLLTGLIFAEAAGDRLSREELLSMVFLLFAAGYETVANFINSSMLTLLNNLDQMRLLRDNLDDPVLVSSAVEELLRYNSPSYMTLPSWAFEDVVLGGKQIRCGDSVHAVLHAANRDPAVFDHPNVFAISRQPNKHLAFSLGIHYCLGAPLARLEGEIALTTLLRWLPDW